MIVKENIEFKRGVDSREALGVGSTHTKNINSNWGIMMDNLKEEFGLYAVRDWSNISIYATKLKNKWTKEEIQEVEDWMYHNTYFTVTRAKTEKHPGREYQGRLTWELMLRVRDTREADYKKKKEDYMLAKALGESIEFKRTGSSKIGLGVGISRYREDIDALVAGLTQAIIDAEGKSKFGSKYAVWPINKMNNPWRHEHLGNYEKKIALRVRSRIFDPRQHEKQRFKEAIRNWIKRNTDLKIHSFTLDKSTGGSGNDYNLILK